MKYFGSVLVIAVVSLAVLVSQKVYSSETVILNGKYSGNWDKSPKKLSMIKTELKLISNGEYEAIYTFIYDNGKDGPKNFISKGKVKGNLISGTVSGTASARGRSFGFRGTAENGVIKAKAFELKGRREHPQGEIEFKK